ncbi:MAG: hypothetical protein CL735_02425 [Chloroflexi bacterium]|nr:hypothetical protein [Chloroflexota bacterium]|tara:strand:- start:64129 stop:64446 length:318 start_codon:yes stop_codon:yes gene_type:complete
MPEQQYKREIEEILRLADESEDPDLEDISYDDQFSVLQYYFLKMKESLRISFWPFSSGLILLVSLITLVSSIVFKFLIPSVAQFVALGALLIFILGYATIFITRK